VKATLLILLGALCFAGCCRANSVIVIEIATTDAGISYTMNAQPKTPAEIEGWLREAIRTFGDADPVLVCPDNRTSFKTVLEMLQRFKAAGVKHFEVFAVAETDGGTRVRDSLSGTADNIRSERFTRPAQR